MRKSSPVRVLELAARKVEVGKEIAALPSHMRSKLIERWTSLYKRAPPDRLSIGFLVSGIAYRIQENAFGGLKPSVRKKLVASIGEMVVPPIDSIGTTTAKPVSGRPTTVRRPIRPGMLLIREWQGEKHTVTVIESGALYKGRRYSSLSPVAKAITGTHWSGPRFFAETASRE